MFKTRLLSGIVLVILAIGFIILGGDILLAVIGLISLIGMYELYRVLKIEKSVIGIIGYLAAIVYFLNIRFAFIPDILMLVFAFLILLLFAYVFSYPKYDAKQVMTVFFGLFYVAGMLSYVYQIRMLENGKYLAFLVFICSWGCDTCAYCVGKLIGKHKMSPILSPKKSVEGAFGGVIGAALLAALYAFIFRNAMSLSTVEIWIIAGITAVAALISMVGDLAASAIKRNYDIKDYGTLIPGHGGILDRFDSMIITAPIIFYLALYAMQ
ncbi:MAG: phosphatidate cytidylyltransferase [Lachnospiraceae bacterium]|nr:phosphatidate cytidylyltransferase [Lachnospiraceae bacterium]